MGSDLASRTSLTRLAPHCGDRRSAAEKDGSPPGQRPSPGPRGRAVQGKLRQPRASDEQQTAPGGVCGTEVSHQGRGGPGWGRDMAPQGLAHPVITTP